MTKQQRYFAKHPLRSTWGTMKQRCINPNNPSHKYYGERGIRVCERWLNYDNFVEDMGERPSLKHSIERIDTNGNYEPSNCRWATLIEQANNKRNNRLVEYGGKGQTLAQWARDLGINRHTLAQRYYTYGWPVERCLTEALHK